MRSVPSFRWLVLPLFVAVVGCAGNTSVPDEADVPAVGTDAGEDTGVTNPLTCPDGQTRCGDECFNLASDRFHCGSCTTACGATEECSASTCRARCPTGQTDCSGACVDTATDPAHCGACGTACAAAQTCTAGACQAATTCEAGQIDCGGMCVNTAVAPSHCGGCGQACAAGERCTDGSCSPAECPSGQMRCGAACVDTRADLGNCGMCGRSCGAGETCVAGACQGSCPAPRMACTVDGMSACLDTSSDSNNCGSCGTACTMGQRCTMGTCQCPAGQTACGGRCLDTTSDPANCGACGTACMTGTSCVSGRCACPMGQTLCGTRCVNVQTDAANCGMCGRACATGSSCSAGACSTVCMTGQTQCSGRCVNVQTDAANCGACGTACASGTACTAGACAPSNNARASARVITLSAGETTVTGTTAGATHDAPTVPCGCTSGADVWYRFTLTEQEVVYLDTAGSTLDTSLVITNEAGVAVPAQTGSGNPNLGLCNDDGGCASGASGFTSTLNSRTAGVLGMGTWYVAVGGCGTGNFTLRVQHIPTGLGSYFYSGRLQGDGTTSTVLVGTSRIAGTCGGTASGEDVRWFLTCGSTQQFFSLCASDGGTYERREGTTNYDPAIYIRSAITNTNSSCNDDGGTMGGTNCRGTGTGADTLNFGSRLNNVATSRGLHALVVDERIGGSGMNYTLRYIVR